MGGWAGGWVGVRAVAQRRRTCQRLDAIEGHIQEILLLSQGVGLHQGHTGAGGRGQASLCAWLRPAHLTWQGGASCGLEAPREATSWRGLGRGPHIA